MHALLRALALGPTPPLPNARHALYTTAAADDDGEDDDGDDGGETAEEEKRSQKFARILAARKFAFHEACGERS